MKELCGRSALVDVEVQVLHGFKDFTTEVTALRVFRRMIGSNVVF